MIQRQIQTRLLEEKSIKDLKPDNSYVIIPEGRQYANKDNITVLSLLDFLSDVLPVLQEQPKI